MEGSGKGGKKEKAEPKGRARPKSVKKEKKTVVEDDDDEEDGMCVC